MATPAADLTFGPPTSKWHYTRASKSYDLTRSTSNKKFTVKTTMGPEGTTISLAPELSALVIVDMQNYFLHADCRKHPKGLDAVEPTLKVIEKCREVGIQVLFSKFDLVALSG